jgi:RNA polymerase sigma-70 factor (ECF subfamily)
MNRRPDLVTAGIKGFDIERVFREQYGRCVATLIRFLGDINLAEEAVQGAFLIAVERWPETGLPPNPGAWITTTARNRAIDYLRREGSRDDHHNQALLLRDDSPSEDESGDVVNDDRLRLIFTCCHPALARNAQVALTLRLLGGLKTPEIARAFLVPEATMGQRIVRAKRKISAAGIPYRIPTEAELPDRLSGVLAVIYLVFNEGYAASSGDSLVREDLCAEAIRLAGVLVSLMPDEPEATGLLALLLLTDARRPARTGADGLLVQLREQDRSLWDQTAIAKGHSLVRACLRRNRPGPYQIQAAINAVHTSAATADQTDWRQILSLYDQLLRYAPTDVVALNRSIALAEVDGPAAGLAALDGLGLNEYHLLHATRADLLLRLHRPREAAAAYDAALELASNATEQAFLRRQRDMIDPSATPGQ